MGELVRAAEWQRVRGFVAARDGVTALVVAGEAGAGKTTLWRAGIEAADGRRVLRSEASAGEADLAFTGLSDLLPGSAAGRHQRRHHRDGAPEGSHQLHAYPGQ